MQQLEMDRDVSIAIGSCAPIGVMAIKATGAKLTDGERIVVLLSAKDPLSSLAGSRRHRRLVTSWLLGREVNALANPRLEALRRFAVILRIQGHVTAVEMTRFRAAGFDARNAADVEQIVSAWRRQSNSKLQRIAWSLVGLVALASYHLVVMTVEQPMVGILFAGVAAVLIAPILVPRDH